MLFYFQCLVPGLPALKKMAEEEDVLFENSPLRRYLDEVGFTDFERVSIFEKQEGREGGLLSSLWGRTRGLFLQKALIWKSCLSQLSPSSFLVTPSKLDLEAFRKDYISAVANSQILNEDDVRFLSQFDPELFKSIEPSRPGVSHWNLQLTRGHIISAIVALVSILFAVLTDSVFSSRSFALIILSVVGIKLLRQYYFRVNHQRNLATLTSFTLRMKQLAVLFRKSVKLIQEMEFLGKGYTMVGPVIPVLQENGDSLTRSVYPALRKAVMENSEKVIACLQKTAQELILCFPLTVELSGLFTYFSQGSERVRAGGCNGELSLQALKIVTLLVFSLQSELLSRFLLCLSLEANNGNLYDLYTKLFTKTTTIFGIPSEEIAAALKSITSSYHLHKSYCFTSDELVQCSTRVSSTLTCLDAAIHSLQLHLQVGILRVQSLQQIIRNTSDPQGGKVFNPAESSLVNKKLETTFQWLKIDLESALSCLKESEKSFNKTLGKEPLKLCNDKPSSTRGLVNLEESTEPSIFNLNEEETENDKVYEAFSDPLSRDVNEHSASAEDLDIEKNTTQENKQLLQELKAVLFTKTKDPLISMAGYVQPVKAPGHIQADTLDMTGAIRESIGGHITSEMTAVLALNGSKVRGINEKLLFSQLSDEEATSQHTELPNLHSSVAASAVAAAIKRNSTFGLSEENFIAESDSE